jgi:hypothetical protein
MLVARLQDPVGVQPGQQLAVAAGGRPLEVPGGAQAPELAHVDTDVHSGQPDVVARGDEQLARAGAEGAAQLVDRVAQRLARVLLGDVRAQPPGERRAPVRAGRERQPGQELAGAGVSGQLDGPPVHRGAQAAEDADVEHVPTLLPRRAGAGRAPGRARDAPRDGGGTGARDRGRRVPTRQESHDLPRSPTLLPLHPGRRRRPGGRRPRRAGLRGRPRGARARRDLPRRPPRPLRRTGRARPGHRRRARRPHRDGPALRARMARAAGGRRRPGLRRRGGRAGGPALLPVRRARRRAAEPRQPGHGPGHGPPGHRLAGDPAAPARRLRHRRRDPVRRLRR